MNTSGKISFAELVYSLRESADALTFCNVYSSVFSNGEGEFPTKQIELIFDFFEDCIENALPKLSACLVRVTALNGELSCRIVLDNVKTAVRDGWQKKECEKLGAKLSVADSDETLYATLTFGAKEARR